MSNGSTHPLKLEFLSLLLKILQARHHRVLLFTHFVGTLALSGMLLDHLAMTYTCLDGNMDSSAKQTAIDEFNEPHESAPFAFLISTQVIRCRAASTSFSIIFGFRPPIAFDLA